MDSTRKWFNLGTSVLALFIVGLLLGSVTAAWAELEPMRIDAGAKDVSWSYLRTNSGYITPGTSGSITFWVYNSSLADEGIDTVKIDFPADVTVDGATHCVMEPWFDRYLEYNGVTGDGAMPTWFDPNGGAGDLGIYEFGIITVDVTVGLGFSGDMVIPWEIRGDGSGGAPNVQSGTAVIYETAPIVVDNHAPYSVTGDFTNQLVMDFTLRDLTTDDWLDDITLWLDPTFGGQSATNTDFAVVRLYNDSDGDGVFEPGTPDELVAPFTWDGSAFVIADLGSGADNPVTTGGDQYFVAVDIAGSAGDDEIARFWIPWFSDDATPGYNTPGFDHGFWYLGGDTGPGDTAIVNPHPLVINRYSVMADYTINNVTDPDWVGPLNTQVLILDFEVPDNWYLADEMTAITFENFGSATNADIVDLQVWRDDGTPGWNDGGETVVGQCEAFIDDQNWYLDLSATPETIPVGGARFFLTCAIADTATDGAGIQMGIPQLVDAAPVAGEFDLADEDKGVFFASRNDGPFDGDLVNSESIVIDSGPPDIAFDEGVGTWTTDDANAYGSYARQTTTSDPVLVGGAKGHTLDTLEVDTNQYGASWATPYAWSKTIRWTVTYDASIVTPDKWVVEGQNADGTIGGPGVQTNQAQDGVQYFTDGNELSFYVMEDGTPTDGEYFYFYTTRNIVGLPNPLLEDDDVLEAEGDEYQDELDLDEIIVSVDGITDPGSGIASVRIYCTFDNSDPTTTKTTVKDMFNVAGDRYWTNGATPDNILPSELTDGNLVKFIVRAVDNVGNVAESEIQRFEIDNTGPASVAPTFTWNADNTLNPPNVVNVGDVLNLNVDMVSQEVPSFTEIVSIKADITSLLNETDQTFDWLNMVSPYNGLWTVPVTIADMDGSSGKDDDTELPAGLAAVVQVIDHIGNMDETIVYNVADNSQFNGFDNFNPETPPPTVSLDQDNTTVPPNTINIGDVVQVEVDVNAVDDTGVLFVHVDMQAYGTSYSANEPLNDGGYDGDDIAGDGIWSREFLVEDAGANAVDQLNLDNTVSAILTDDAGNPDPTPEMIAPGNTLDIDTDAPGATANNWDIVVSLPGAKDINWLAYYGDTTIANPGDRAIVAWNAAADGETTDVVTVTADASQWGGPSEITLLVDEGGQEGASFNDWDGDHDEDPWLFGALWDFVEGTIDDPTTFAFLTVTDDAGNVVTCSTGTDEGAPAEPLSVDIILPLGNLTVTVGHAANPPKAMYAGINDTLFFTFDASATNPFDVIPPNGGVAVDLTDFGFPFQTTPLVLNRNAAPDTMKWSGWYQIGGAGMAGDSHMGPLGTEIAFDVDMDFEATVYDDALNEFTDNFGTIIHCDNSGVVDIMPQYTSIWVVDVNLADGIAAIGDTIYFGFDNSDATGQDVGDIRNGVAGVYVDTDRDGVMETSDLQLTDPDMDEMWMGYHVVTDSSGAQPWAIEDTAKVTFGFYSLDNGINTSPGGPTPSNDSIYVDNIRPEGTLANSTVTDVTTGTVQKVSVGDILNINYTLDRINDNVTCHVDLQAYGYSDSYSLGSTLSLNLPVKDVDDPDYILDVLPGNALIEPTMTICTNPEEVTDNAGNTYVPACVLPFDWTTWGVDNDAPVTATPTVLIMDDHDYKGNGIVNFGDRMDIHCNMSAIPDMAGGTVLVNLYGYGGNSVDDVDAGLTLTDDAFSEGGEGDLVFSFVLQDAAYTGGFMKGFVIGSGPDGAPGDKGVDDDNDGEFDVAEELFTAGDDRTGNIDTDPPVESTNPPVEFSAIEVKAFDDDGCPAESGAESAELTWVVDTYEPDLDDVDLEFHDSDGPGEPGHGIVNIGDTLVVYADAITNVGLMSYDHYGAIPVTVDMSHYGYSEDEPISAVFDTTTWGAAETWYRMFVIQEGDDGIDVGVSDSDSRVGATGWDDADNWMLDPIYSSPLPYQVDSDMPGAVQNLTAAPVQGGRIRLEWIAPPASPKVGGYTDDVAYYHIYQGEPDSDLVDYTEPTESISPATTVWYSDTLLAERTYLFGVRVEDDAGNIEENMNVVSGKIPDSIVPYATITSPPNGNLTVWGPDGLPGEANVDDDGANGVDDPGEVGFAGTDDYTFDVVATMSDMDVVQADYYWRVQDADLLLEGDQPGPWVHLGTVTADYIEQETFTLTLDGSAVPSNTYEVIVVPTDGAGNYPSHMEAYEFNHIVNMWDNDDPALIYVSINGDASPNSTTLIPQGVIPMIVHAEDYGQQTKDQVPSYIKVSVMPEGYMVPIEAYVAGGVEDWPHHFTINTTGFPNGLMYVYLWLWDASGNSYTMPAVEVTIEDVTAPTAEITNPEHGDHITGSAFPIIVEPGLDAYGNPVTDLARVDAYYSEDGSEPWNWIGFDTTPEEDKQASVFYMIPWNTNDLVHDEDYYLLCEITDNAANKDTTATIMVVKDTTALPLTLEVDDLVMVNGVPTINDTVRINAWSNDPNITQVKFEWRYAWDPDEDAFYFTLGTDYNTPYYQIVNTQLVGGANWDQQNYPIVVKATPKDDAGNDMQAVYAEVTVDNKPPWFSIYSINGFINSGDVDVMGGTDVEIVVHTLDPDVALCRLQALGTPTGPIGIAELTAYESHDPVTGIYTYEATWTVPVYNDNTEITIHCGGRDMIDNPSMPQGGDDFFALDILGTEAMTVMMSVPQHGANIMGVWTAGMIKGTTGNTDVARAELQFQTPDETIWHTYGTDESGPTWENPLPIITSLMADGDWNMRFKAWDADGNPDEDPQHITVTIDNTPPVAVIDAFDMERANKEILLTAECSDDKGAGTYPASVQFVDFWVKLDNDETLNYTLVGTDYTAPYEFTYDTRDVPDGDGMYHFVATGTDNAGFHYGFPGNMQDPTYAHYEMLDIDNSGPADLMISDIGDNHNPPTQGSTLPQAEELTIIATSTDLDVAWFRFYFKHIDAMDYNEIDTDTEVEIVDGQSVGSAVVNTMNWMAGDVYVIKVEAADDLGNEALTYYDFKIGLPMAYIISIDDETGEIVAECNNTAKSVKFDFEPNFKGKKSKAWEGIEIVEVDSNGYAKVTWHYNEMAVGDGDYNVRAWASDDPMEWAEGLKQDEEDVGHWSFTKTGNHFEITESTLEGFQLTTPNDNSDPELIQVNVYVPSGYGEPTLYVVIDDAPNDPMVGPVDYEVDLIPSANDPNLYEPDPNNQVRLDPIATGGVADFFATLPSIPGKGAMDVLTDQIVVAEVTLTDGGSTASESGNWEVSIPAGALNSGADGLVARDVAVTPQSPSHQLHLKPVGGAVSVFMMSNYYYYFNSGYYATFVAHYDDTDLPEQFDENDISVAWWDDYGYSKEKTSDEWEFDGLRIIDLDTELNTLTFNADFFYGYCDKSSPYGGGTIFSLIANMPEGNQGTIEITAPSPLPTIDGVTWAMPDLYSHITDEVSLIDGDEVQMWLDGVRIWDDWDAARGFSGHFDNDVSGELRVWWSDYYEGGWHCAPPLMGGEHEVTVSAMNEVENYHSVTSTFTVEYPDENSITDIIFLGSGNARLIDGVWYTDEFPVLQANVHDPFARMYFEDNCYDYDDYAGVQSEDLQVEIDGIEYAAAQYFTEDTGTWGVMEYYQPEELTGGEHTYTIYFTRNQVTYEYTGTFMVETVDVSSITNWWFQEPIVTVGDVIWTHPCPTIKANISDLFGTLTWHDIELRIDGKEYDHVHYECGSTGDAGIMTYEHPYDDMLTDGEHYFTIGITMNGVTFVTEQQTFMVDATEPSLHGFTGGYVGATPSLTFTLSDLATGVDMNTVHLDLYHITQTTTPPNDPERKEFLYTAFPSMMTFDQSGTDVTVTYNPVLNLQDGEEFEITLYGGSYTTYGYDSDDTGDRFYRDSDGVRDNVDNILTPATKRYIVDVAGPEVAEMEVMEDGMICYIFQDLGAGLTCDDIEIHMDDEVFEDYECEELDRTRVAVCFDPGDIGAEFKIKITDAAGNFTIERFINETLDVTLGEDAHCYPNPAHGGHTTIMYTVSKKTGVEVSMKIYDFAGQMVKTLYRGQPQKVGANEVVWYLDDDGGNAVGRGAYLCRIVAKDDSKTSAKVVKIAVAETY
jgi:hypothetical protein